MKPHPGTERWAACPSSVSRFLNPFYRVHFMSFLTPPTYADPFADFSVAVVQLNHGAEEASASGQLAVLGWRPEPPYRGGPSGPLKFPALEVGALVVGLTKDVCSHAGILTDVTASPQRLTCAIQLWPLEVEVPFRPFEISALSGKPQGIFWYTCARQGKGPHLVQDIARLDKVAAATLRELIGPVAPERIAQVFWCERERQAFADKAAIQTAYVEAANGLLQELAQ